MATTYRPFQIALTAGHKQRLQKAFATKTAVTLRLKPEQIEGGDELLLTATQIGRKKKTVGKKRGSDLKMSKTQTAAIVQRGGNLYFSPC